MKHEPETGFSQSTSGPFNVLFPLPGCSSEPRFLQKLIKITQRSLNAMWSKRPYIETNSPVTCSHSMFSSASEYQLQLLTYIFSCACLINNCLFHEAESFMKVETMSCLQTLLVHHIQHVAWSYILLRPMYLYMVSSVDTSMHGLIFQSEMEKFSYSSFQKNSFVAQ